jgi:hypothetical protein
MSSKSKAVRLLFWELVQFGPGRSFNKFLPRTVNELHYQFIDFICEISCSKEI